MRETCFLEFLLASGWAYTFSKWLQVLKFACVFSSFQHNRDILLLRLLNNCSALSGQMCFREWILLIVANVCLFIRQTCLWLVFYMIFRRKPSKLVIEVLVMFLYLTNLLGNSRFLYKFPYFV